MLRPKPQQVLIWNSARASSSGEGLLSGMRVDVRVLQLEAARRIADGQEQCEYQSDLKGDGQLTLS